MENGGSTITIKGILSLLMESISELEDEEGRCVKRVISLGMGDPTLYSCFRTTQVSLQAVSDSLLSNKFHGYAPTVGLPQTRRLFSSFTCFLFLLQFNAAVYHRQSFITLRCILIFFLWKHIFGIYCRTTWTVDKNKKIWATSFIKKRNIIFDVIKSKAEVYARV